MTAGRRQRILRALAFLIAGTGGALLLTFDPASGLRSFPLMAMLLGLSAWTIAENATLQHDEPERYRGLLTTRLLQAGVMLAIFIGVVDHFHLQLLRARWWLTWLGLAMLFAGAYIRVTAIRTLAEHFRYDLQVAQGQGLVRTGLYARIRHPSYLGVLLIATGAALTVQSVPAALLALLLLVPVMILRMRDEERMLQDAFGASYETYRRESWRLVPFLY